MTDPFELRFDYARIRIATDADIAMQRTEHLKELIELWRGQGNDNTLGGHQFRVFPGGSASERQYCLELWGPLAEVITWLDFEEWADRLMRVDVRKEVPAGTPYTIRQLGDQLAAKKGRLNVTRYESKGRSKRNGRSAGGSGIALGSHKSIFRASIYKRSHEKAAMEFQWSGAAADKAVQSVTAMRRSPATDADPWGALRRHLYVDGLERLQRATSLDYSDLLDILGGRVRAEPQEVYEQLAFSIQADFLRLPQGKRIELLDYLQANA